MADGKLRVRIVTPKQVIFDDQADSVSSVNSSGKFDILPQHANFISIVENVPIIIRSQNKKPQSFTFPVAIIYNIRSMVNIYTDIAIKI